MVEVFAKTKSSNRIKVSPGVKGAIGEHLATAWLMARGYDVFRNVAPNGRADLIAVDWVKDETIRVDVKSSGFSAVGGSPMASGNRAVIERNKGFDIRYLVVQDDGDCIWYTEEGKPAANDNTPVLPLWWTDKRSGQKFVTPGNEMQNRSWAYFCHWLIRTYPKYMQPFSEDFIRGISARGIGNDSPRIDERELVVLRKILKYVFDQLMAKDRVILSERFSA